MEEPTPSPSEPGADLFDRWLAHRDGAATPPQPRTSVEDTLEPAPEPATVLAEPAPPPEPEIDLRELEEMVIAESQARSTDAVLEPDLDDTDEARRAEEARLEAERDAHAAHAAEEARLQAERDALATRLAEEARLQAERDAQATRLAEETRLQAERDAQATRLAEEARAGAVGSGHGVLAAFAAASATPEAEVEAEVEATPEAEAAEPAAPLEDAPERLSWSTGSPLSRLSRRRRPAEAPIEAPAAPLDPAHEVFAAFAAAKPTPTPQPAAAPTPTGPPPRVSLVSARTAPETPAAPAKTPEPRPDPAPVVRAVQAPDRPGPSRNVTFKPKHGARRLVGLLLLAVVAATAYAGYLAYEAQTTESIVVAAGLGVFMLALWAIRAGSSVSRLSVTNGQLEVVNASGRFVFDLTSAYMPIEVVGTPGQRKWKVLFVRRSMPPFTVDSSMVDPKEFMAVLREFRPERDAP